RRLGQHQLLAAENVIDVDALDRQHVDIGNVARGGREAGMELGSVDDQRIGNAEAGEMRDQRLGLGGFERGLVDNDEAAVFGLGRERMAKRERADLLGQTGRMRTHHGTEGTATAAELRHAGRAVTGATGALLLVHLLAGAPDLGAALGLVGAGLTLVELPLHAALNDVLARLEAEDAVGKLDRTGRFALKRCYFQFHHAPSPWAGASRACSPPATLNLPGFGASFGSG